MTYSKDGRSDFSRILVESEPWELTENQLIGLRMRYARSMKGMTAKQVADLLMVTQQYLTSWESGRSKPNVELFAAAMGFHTTSLTVPSEVMAAEKMLRLLQFSRGRADWLNDGKTARAWLGNVLRREREKYNISETKLAELVQTNRRTVYTAEHPQTHSAGAEPLARMCVVLRLSPVHLYWKAVADGVVYDLKNSAIPESVIEHAPEFVRKAISR